MTILMAWVAGMVFGIGLLLSGMTNPAKVIGFLDITGQWDPSLMFVMMGAIPVTFIGYQWAKRCEVGLLGQPFQWPTSTILDKPLVLGAMLFGLGWGAAGFCPGPAIASIAAGNESAITFTISMIAGMGLFEVYQYLTSKSCS